MRVMAEDARQKVAGVDGTYYNADKGFFEMPDHHAKVHLKASNLPMPNLAGVLRRSVGYRCTACGFGSFFATCKCGAPCVKEGNHART